MLWFKTFPFNVNFKLIGDIQCLSSDNDWAEQTEFQITFNQQRLTKYIIKGCTDWHLYSACQNLSGYPATLYRQGSALRGHTVKILET